MTSRRPRASALRDWSTVVGAASSKIVDLLVENAVNLLGVVAVVLLLATGSGAARLLGAGFGVVALGLTAWLLRREVRRGHDLLTALAPQRLILVLALAGGYLARRPDAAGWVWAATGVLVLTVLTEPTVRHLLAKAQPVAVRLPGVPQVPGPPFSPRVPAVVTLAEVVVGSVLAASAAPGWTYLVLAGLGALVVSALAVHCVRAVLVSRRSAAGVRAGLERLQPAFAVYYAGTHGARYQLGMWLPYLERLNRPFVVITRQADTVPVIAQLTTAPILVPRLHSVLGNLDQMVTGSMRAAFYVQGSASNLTFQRYRRLTHIWLNHGDSDKAANFGARHATYDRIFVAGQQGVDRYAAHGVRVPPERFAVVGRPQVEHIEVRDSAPAPGTPRTVLYAPTWRGGRPSTDYSSLRLGDRIVAALLERGDTVIFRPHPLSYSEPEDASHIGAIHARLRAARAATGRAHMCGRQAETAWDVAACINASDALVTDVSSVAADYLASGKPFAMVAVRAKGERFRRDFPMARVAYVIEQDLSTLQNALDQLHGSDPLAADRDAYRRYCLGEHVGPRAADEFLRVAGDIVDGTS